MDPLDLVRWQFRVAWSLAADVHLPRLTDEVCLWQPHPTSWTVRRSADGRWPADWADEDPVDPAPPSVGWLTWHLLWWWSDALSVVRGDQPASRADVEWPGNADAVTTALRGLAESWTGVLTGLTDADLATERAFPWPTPRPLVQLLGWVNLELMKNVAEIGEITNMYQHRPGG